jgi:hypothetical protein
MENRRPALAMASQVAKSPRPPGIPPQRRVHKVVIPPSTANSAPVAKADSSLARNT